MAGYLNLDIHTLVRSLQSSNGTSSEGGMKFMTGYQPGEPQYSNTVMVYIRNDNQIGINTLNPVATLDVNGTIKGKFTDFPDFGQTPPDPKIFIQNSEIDGIPRSHNEGDFWWDTINNPPYLYTAAAAEINFIGVGGWEFGVSSSLIPADVKVTQSFEPPPESENVGDIWFNLSKRNLAYRAAIVGATEIKDGEWELADDINDELGLGAVTISLTGIMADAVVIAYFNVEDTAAGFVRGVSGVHSNASYGDIWLDLSEISRYSASARTTNAINRWQNSVGGYANTGQPANRLAWRHAPDDGLGQVYLDTYAARNTADRKSVIYYSAMIGDLDVDGVAWGPNVATTPDGFQDNPMPQYDIWWDITEMSVPGAPGEDPTLLFKNHPYIYLTNSEFSTSYVSTGLGAWSQTVHSGLFVPGSSASGWWDVQDSELLTAKANISILGGLLGEMGERIGEAEESLGEIIAGAVVLGQAVDHEVIVNFLPVAGHINYPPGGTLPQNPGATGNGDVWIWTDYAVDPLTGLANNDAIYIAAKSNVGITDNWWSNNWSEGSYTHYWVPSPENGLGKVFLEMWSMGTIGSFFRGDNIMPRGYSLFEAPASDYSNTASDDADAPINNVPYPFREYSSGSIDVDIVNDSTSPVGEGKALRLVKRGSPSACTLFSNSRIDLHHNNPTVIIPKGKRWVLSFYSRSDETHADLVPGVMAYPSNTSGMLVAGMKRPNIYKGVNGETGSPIYSSTSWQRYWLNMDLRPLSDTGYPDFRGGFAWDDDSYDQVDDGGTPELLPTDFVPELFDRITIRVDPGGWSDTSGEFVGNNIFYTGLQLEEVTENIYGPSPFKDPSDASSIAFGRRITDGKIVVHWSKNYGTLPNIYGPNPLITPTGLPNPEPHMDLWLNTSNNNMTFRYHQNATVNYAQTAFFTHVIELTQSHPSGWYAADDNRFDIHTANLVQNYEQIRQAFANVDNLRLGFDHDPVIFLNVDDGGAYSNANSSHTNAVFSDIWINNSDYNKLATGALSTNAIFRWQNGTAYSAEYPFGRTSPGIGSAGDSAWYHAKESPFGQLYVGSYHTRNIADRQSIMYIGPYHPSDGGGTGFGPNVAHSSVSPVDGSERGPLNLNPRGDLWINTDDGNRLYAYLANDEFGDTYQWLGTGVAKPYWSNRVQENNPSFDETNDPTGWYDAQDTKIAILTQNAFDNYQSTQWALSNAASAQAAADSEIISYRANEGDPGFIIHDTTSGPGGVAYGDIWLNPAPWNTQLDGSLSTNAILRWQNSTGGSAKTIAGVSNLAWNYAPNNAIGLVFLDSYWAKNVADRKTVIYYESNTSGFGPNVAITPTGQPNPNPYGDLWIDTGGGNRMYIYLTNSQFQIGTYVGTGTGRWAQTVSNGAFDRYADPTGWYDGQDTQIYTVTSTVAGALSAIGALEAQTDRELFAFFEPSTAGATLNATGNGDIWIHTDTAINPDGSANNDAIYVSNAVATGISDSDDSHKWIPSPENAIGQMFLRNYSNAVSGVFERSTNIMERPYSLWNSPIDDYNFRTRHVYDNPNAKYLMRMYHKTSGTPSRNIPYSYIYSQESNGIMGMGATGNVAFLINSDQAGSQPGEIFVTNEGGVEFQGPDGNVWIISTDPEDLHTPYEGSGQPDYVTSNSSHLAGAFLMFSNTDVDLRFNSEHGVNQWGSHKKFVPVEWWDDENTWMASDNDGHHFPFIPDSANGDFIVAEFIRGSTDSVGIDDLHNWIFDPDEVDRAGPVGALSTEQAVNGYQDASNRLWFSDWTDPDPDRNKPYQLMPMGHLGDVRVNTSYGWSGSESLQLTTSGYGACSFIYFSPVTWHDYRFWDGDTTARSTVTIPKGEKWVLSWRVKTDAPGIGTGTNPGRFGVWVFGSESSNIGKPGEGTTPIWFTPSAGSYYMKMSGNTSWEQHWLTLDFRNHINATEYSDLNLPTSAGPTVMARYSSNPNGTSPLYTDHIDSLNFAIAFPGNSYIYGSGSGVSEAIVSNNYWFDAFQLEQVPDESASPSRFKDPSSAATVVFGRQITDGKIVAHYSEHYPTGHGAGAGINGPIPYLTPTGLSNREPHGDLWINTSNNNQIFRYYQSDFTTIPTAQTIYWTTTTSASGWYTTEDPRIVYSHQNVIDHAANISNIFANLDVQRTLLEHDTVTFYESEGGDFILLGENPSANFGDLWIDISSHNHLLTGGLDTNAINRYQNTMAGQGESSEGTLVWESAPENALGKVYLDTYLARNAADRKTVTYYVSNTYSAPHYYGPNVAVDMAGVLNPNPHGDLWIDIGGSNRLYLYLTNSSFNATYISTATGGANSWAQTSHNGTFTATADPSGWWDIQGFDSSVIEIDILLNKDAAANALANAQFAQQLAANAQAIADGEIISFYSVDDKSYNSVKNILPEGLSVFNSGANATHLYDPADYITATQIGMSTDLGVPYNIHGAGSLDFIEGEGYGHANVALKIVLANTTDPSPSGSNYTEAWNIWEKISIPKGKKWIFSYWVKSNSEHGHTRTLAYGANNTHSLGAAGYIYDTTDSYAYRRVDGADIWTQHRTIFDFTQSSWGAAGPYPTEESHGPLTEWDAIQLRPWVVSLSSENPSTGGGVANVGIEYYFSGLQLEEVASGVTDPTRFANDITHTTAKYGDIWIDTSPHKQLANGALAANALYRYQNSLGSSSYPAPPGDPATELKWFNSPDNAIGKVYLDAWKSQNTADAKVVTHIAAGTPLGTVPALYGPDPSTTPSGVHNPNPESDLWLDSNDNNRIYRYQVIGGNVTSTHAYQTPNNTLSGWADVRDARIGDFPFAEHRKAYVPMNEWSITDMGYGEELVMWDESDNLNHARQGLHSSEFSGDHNDFVDTTIKGISTKALNRTNSITAGDGTSGNYNKDIALLHHDDIRNANQQSYSIWFKPTGGYQRHGHRIISRDASDFWAVLIGGNATSYRGETESYDEFNPAAGSYVNVVIQGASTDSPTGSGEALYLAAPGRSPGGILKYDTWNHIAFTLDYKGDNEYGNSVWYFTNEDDGWENANVFHFTLDKDTSANHNHGSATGWSVDGEGRGVGLNNVERANAAGSSGGYAPVAHYSEFRYYDTFLSQASVKKLFDSPTGIEESSQGLLRTIRSQAVADGEIISYYSDNLPYDGDKNYVSQGYSLFDADSDDYEIDLSLPGPAEGPLYPITAYSDRTYSAEIDASPPVSSPIGNVPALKILPNYLDDWYGSTVYLSNNTMYVIGDSPEFSAISEYGFDIPTGKKWILSAYVMANNVGLGNGHEGLPSGKSNTYIQAYLFGANTSGVAVAGHYPISDGEGATFTYTDTGTRISPFDRFIDVKDTWQRVHWVYDLTGNKIDGTAHNLNWSGSLADSEGTTLDNEVNKIALRFDTKAEAANGDTEYYITGIQWEEYEGSLTQNDILWANGAAQPSPIGGFVRGESITTANFGDIWINTSDYNADLDHGGLTVNAINRYQNTSFGPSPSEGTLVWESTPTNSIGKVYLDAASARNMADQKTISYYVANGDIGTGYGPNVAVTPSGTLNPNPDSDLWVDTLTNRLYIYKTNGAFSPSYTTVGTGDWSQTIYSATFDLNAKTGWYDVQDSQIAVQGELILANKTATSEALANAVTAQAAADHEIIVFFESSSNSDMVTTVAGSATGPATGNGDVWIQTDYAIKPDGTQNSDSILVANLHPGVGWVQSPRNAIGKAFLETLSETGVKNWAHTQYSSFETSSPETDYFMDKDSVPTVTTLATSLEVDNLGAGTPVHILLADNVDDFAGDIYKYVHVRLKAVDVPEADAIWLGNFCWGTERILILDQLQTAYLGSSGTSTTIIDKAYWSTLSAGSSFVDIVWDLSENSNWTEETITGPLRFIFWNASSNNPNTTIKYEIDYIIISESSTIEIG